MRLQPAGFSPFHVFADPMDPAGVHRVVGERAFFEPDGVTYIRWYTREEITEIFHRAGLDVTTFDEVRHHPDVSRLLAVGSKR